MITERSVVELQPADREDRRGEGARGIGLNVRPVLQLDEPDEDERDTDARDHRGERRRVPLPQRCERDAVDDHADDPAHDEGH